MFTDKIKAIPVAKTYPPDGAFVIHTGWGQTVAGPIQNNSATNDLQLLTSTFVAPARCAELSRGIPYYWESMSCTVPVSGSGTCFGEFVL